MERLIIGRDDTLPKALERGSYCTPKEAAGLVASLRRGSSTAPPVAPLTLQWTSTGEILARKADRGRCQRGGGNDEQPPRVARAQPVDERCAVLLEDRELQ